MLEVKSSIVVEVVDAEVGCSDAGASPSSLSGWDWKSVFTPVSTSKNDVFVNIDRSSWPKASSRTVPDSCGVAIVLSSLRYWDTFCARRP